MARYKNPQFQKLYDGILKLAGDLTSEMYHEGRPRRGAGTRCAFWDGYAGVRSPKAIPNTMGMVCYQAGKHFAKTNPGIEGATFVLESFQGGPRTVAQRVAALRERRQEAGLAKLEVWAHPENHGLIKAYAAKLHAGREATASAAGR